MSAGGVRMSKIFISALLIEVLIGALQLARSHQSDGTLVEVGVHLLVTTRALVAVNFGRCVALVERNGGQVQAAGDVAVEAEQGRGGHQLQKADDDDDDVHPLGEVGPANCIIVTCHHENPDSLGDVVEQEQDVQQQ